MSAKDQLLKKVAEFRSQVEVNLVAKAFDFGAKAHEGQLRQSGEPYFSHPMAVAMTLADMRLDGKDLYNNYDALPDQAGNNGTIVSVLKTEDWPLPLLFRAGISMDAFRSDEMSLVVAADALRPSDSAEILNVGGEFSWRDMVFIRGGLKSLFLPEREETFTLGAGAKYEVSGANIVSFDFSHQEFGKFGGIQSFAIGVTF